MQSTPRRHTSTVATRLEHTPTKVTRVRSQTLSARITGFQMYVTTNTDCLFISTNRKAGLSSRYGSTAVIISKMLVTVSVIARVGVTLPSTLKTILAIIGGILPDVCSRATLYGTRVRGMFGFSQTVDSSRLVVWEACAPSARIAINVHSWRCTRRPNPVDTRNVQRTTVTSGGHNSMTRSTDMSITRTTCVT